MIVFSSTHHTKLYPFQIEQIPEKGKTLQCSEGEILYLQTYVNFIFEALTKILVSWWNVYSNISIMNLNLMIS